MTAKVRMVSAEEIAAKDGSLLPEDYLVSTDPGQETGSQFAGCCLTEEMKEVVLRTVRRYLDNPTAEMQLKQDRPVRKRYEPGDPHVKLEPSEYITLTLTIRCVAGKFQKEG